jgi:hypothetical protein
MKETNNDKLLPKFESLIKISVPIFFQSLALLIGRSLTLTASLLNEVIAVDRAILF